jgi:sec-independent protein translocase protein TatA
VGRNSQNLCGLGRGMKEFKDAKDGPSEETEVKQAPVIKEN